MSAVNPPPVPKAKNRKSTKKGAPAPNNKGFFVTEQEFERRIAKAERDAVNNAVKTTVKPVVDTAKAAKDLPGNVVKALSKPFTRIALGAGGVVLILFALARFTAPVTSQVAGAVSPVGKAAKLGKVAKTV